MRKFLVAFVLILCSSSAVAAMAWTPTSRGRWRSFDLVCRRLELIMVETDNEDVRRAATWALWHIRAIRDQHGGAFEEDRQIELYSVQEQELIAAQHGRAGRAEHLNDLIDSAKYHTTGKFWKWTKRL